MPEAQAVTTAWFGPIYPCLIEICPEARLIRLEGMKNGVIFLMPLSFKVITVFSIAGKPPIPEPIMTPVRYFCSSLSAFQPESAIAWSAAPIANKMKRSILRCSFGSTCLSGLNKFSPSPNFTSPAILHGDSVGSKIVILSMPDSEFISLFQVFSALLDKGVTAPMPVTTTRLLFVIV